ncbi:hypothetical protein JHN59_40640 [Streptomyces sp. MBT49]|uniref:hypothetical protein n=2 Tax=unclassified Streptomyces TaxID=2593676 RepID=UPI00190E03C5|nr:hypothetical protein [Streptomyces sp. MBT49]MBK3630987.1 hypothetical protein [Streptomyces sp. MBT49]
MSNTTAKAAKLLVLLVEAETAAAEARKVEARTAKAAERAAARVHKQRAVHAEASKEFNKAERAAKNLITPAVKAAARKSTRQWEKLKGLQEAAKAAKAEATVARRAARTAARRLDRLSLRAATAAARTVETISQRLGETSLTPAAETDRTLAADEIPTVEEIELHATRYATLDRQAKDAAKAADAEKTWLRALPVGTYGRVVITRTPGRSVLDGTQVALDYTARGLTAPRKATRTTFKCDATALLADLADLVDVVETADDLGVILAA